MRRRAAMALGVFAVCSPLCALAAPAAVLPLTAVRLYETGIGHFTRAGRLDGGSSITLPVPAGHLDDALKTLVVTSSDGKSRVAGIEFGSSLSRGMARALAGLPQKDDEPLDWRAMLVSLKGAAVELRSAGATTRGRVVDVADAPGEPTPEPKAEPKAGAVSCVDARCLRPPPDLSLLLLTDKGELRRFAGRAIEAVHPTEAAFAVRLHAALDALSTRAAQTGHPIRLLGHASGPVTIGYIAEAPIFRTSWRLVIDDQGAVLVGWALLHNDTDEDWKGVKVELVNGQPDSFIYPLAAPRYSRRALLHPENPLSTVPQLLGQTADGMWGDHLDETGEAYGAAGFGLSGVGSGGGGSGHGTIGLGSVGTIGHGGGGGDSDQLGTGNLAGIAAATGVEGAALFTYALPEPLDLRGHGSALVPFLQQRVEAEEITLVGSDRAHPRSAVRFNNSTGQTLPGGPIALFSHGGFAGEAGLDRLKPGERRFLEFGNDLDLTIDERSGGDDLAAPRDETKKVRAAGGVLEEHYLRTSQIVFAIENRAGRLRRALVQLSCAKSATVTGADALDHDPVADRPLAAFKIAPRSKGERKLTVVERLVRRTALGEVSVEQLRRLLDNQAILDEARVAIGRALPVIERRDAGLAKQRQLEADAEALDRDAGRLREDLKSLGGNAAAANPLVQRLAAAEDKLVTMRRRIEEAKVEVKARGAEAETALKAIR